MTTAIVVGGVLWTRHEPSRRSASAAPVTPDTALPAPAAPVCEDGELLAMPLREKLAQLLMVGVTGADDARAVAANYRVGGIFIGGWTDLSMLNDGQLGEITSAAGVLPVAVSVDEEGGRVDRLKSLIGAAPSARELVASGTPVEEVYEQAKTRGLEMAKRGITVDFAPVVDVSDEPDDMVIGDRSFSNDPQTVVRYAGAYARGLRAAGILPVLKHFPGHGHGSGDSHTGSVTTPPLDSLQQDDLIPYRTLVTEQPVAVMVGHLQVPGLTEDLPTSLSPAAYELLRSGNYGGPPFDGLVFTDDLSSMRAISDQYGVAQAVLMALKAGADIALWVTTNEVPEVLDTLEAAVYANDLPLDAVDQKLLRVAHAKSRSPQCPR